MTTNIKFTNFAATTLSSGITNTDTTIQLTSGSAFPTLTGSNYFYGTLVDAATGTVKEIVKVTARSGNTLTVVRAQDNTGVVAGTQGYAYIASDRFELRVVAASEETAVRTDEVILAANKTLTVSETATIAASSITLNGNVQTFPAANATIARTDAAQTFTGTQTVQAAATQDSVKLAGRAGGSSSYGVTITPNTLTASRTATLPDADTKLLISGYHHTISGPTAARTFTAPDESFTLGYRNIPAVGTKTGSYSLATTDVGKYVQLGSGGAITIPDATFAEGDVISLVNNTSGNITITCSITTAYIAGTDSDKATMTLATRGVATIFFLSGTVCVVTGNVT